MNEIVIPEWGHVKAYAEEQLERLRERNDSTAHDLASTQAIRGEIRAWKALLDLPRELAARRAQTSPPSFDGGE